MSRTRARVASVVAGGALCVCALMSADRNRGRPTYHSPCDVAFAPGGRLLAVSDRTGGKLWLVKDGELLRSVAVHGQPAGVAWAEHGKRLYVSEYAASTVAEVNAANGEVTSRFRVGRYPDGVAVAPKHRLLLVANSATHSVSILDLASGHERARLRVPREPHAIALTPDESIAVVANLLPAGRANEPDVAAVVSLIDVAGARRIGDVRLPPGSTDVRHVAISHDGRWAYVVHVIGRTTVPTTQLERGWVNTDALSVIDLKRRKRYATVLLDDPVRGAADPWGVALAPDGSRLWIALSGVHELARIDLGRLHEFLSRRDADSQRGDLTNDLAALTRAGLIERVAIPGKGPRGLAMSPDGERLAVAVYFGGLIALVDTRTARVAAEVPLGEAAKPDDVRTGEIIFHDATKCFQHWLSCATCHPNDGRVDGLDWDLPKDGIGNPKNNKSLLYAQHTPPMDWLGVRANLAVSVTKGFRFLMRQPEPGEEAAVRAYIRSLTPQPSPYLTDDGKLAADAARGRAIFEAKRTRCSHCHSGDYLTDRKRHDVGTRHRLDRSDRFDTPSLIEVYRTGPYLHDGSAATLREVLVDRNPRDRHGRTSHLTAQEIADLVAFLRSL